MRDRLQFYKFKEKSSEEGPSYNLLLLWIVRLIHADPILMLHVRQLRDSLSRCLKDKFTHLKQKRRLLKTWCSQSVLH